MNNELSKEELELIRSSLYCYLRWLERGEFRHLAKSTSELLGKISAKVDFSDIMTKR